MLLASAATAVTFRSKDTELLLDLIVVFRLCDDCSNMYVGRQGISLCDLVVSDLCLTITVTYILENNTLLLDLVASGISGGLGKYAHFSRLVLSLPL